MNLKTLTSKRPSLLSFQSLCIISLSIITSWSANAQPRTGLQTYYRTNPPSAGSPAVDGTWTRAGGGYNSVPIPAAGSVWIACPNGHVSTNQKNFSLTIETSPQGDIHDLKATGCSGWQDNAGTNPSTTTWNSTKFPILGQIVVNATFIPQPAWEYVKVDNTSGQQKTFNIKILSADSHCARTSRTTGDNGVGDARMTFSDAMFGALNAMENENTRITEIELFPRNVNVDLAALPTLDAPQQTGNWSFEFVIADPNGDPRPHGGVRWTTDGAGLLPGEMHDLSLTMTGAADSSYVIFGFDAAVLDYQEILIDLWDLPWYDDFELYAPGQGLHGARGWKGWDNDPAFDAPVTDAVAQSGAQSVQIDGAADLVHEFEGADSGRWSFTAWQYIPSDYVSGGSGRFRGSHFLLLNTYQDDGPYHWSVDVQVDSTVGMLKIYHGDGFNTINVPYETDRWVKIQTIIDLDDDWTRIYYDDNLVTEYPWTGGIFGDGGGASDVAAVDLWANASTPIYYDHLKIELVDERPADVFEIEILSGVILEGDVEAVRSSDDVTLHTQSGFGSSFSDLHRMDMRVGAVTSVESPLVMDLAVEARIGEPSGIARIFVRDQIDGAYDQVASYPIGPVEETHEVLGLEASRYVSELGEIDVRVKHNVFVPFVAFRFESWIDLVEISVR